MLTNGLFEQGHLAKLITDYQLPNIKLPDENIWLIEDDKGQPINDAKSEIEQTYMADFITRKVFELTNKNDISIHASIAGGRKTMAFYLGYAMSLLGREQDSLSASFSQTVASLNSAHKKDLTLEVNAKAKTLTFAGIEIKLTAKETAFYLWLNQYSQSEHKKLVVGRDFEESLRYSKEYLMLCCNEKTLNSSKKGNLDSCRQ